LLKVKPANDCLPGNWALAVASFQFGPDEADDDADDADAACEELELFDAVDEDDPGEVVQAEVKNIVRTESEKKIPFNFI
jgi:hypothetical protein